MGSPRPSERAVLQQQLARERDRLQVLFEITNTLVSKLSWDELLPAISRVLSRVLPHEGAAITVLDRTTGTLRLYAVHAADNVLLDLDPEPEPRPLEELPSGKALASGRPWLTRAEGFGVYPEDIRRQLVQRGVKVICSIPLATASGAIGTLELARISRGDFTPDELEFALQAARPLAIALENSLAFRELAELKEKLALEKLYLEDELRFDHNLGNMVGQSLAFQSLLERIRIVAPTDATVLIEGETGTGKELVARAIHEASKRSGRSFVKVNCAAIPATLLESELFGHEKGAFTGALAQKIGRFEVADGGTLFLDEVGEIPLDLQPKLLRAIQEQEFERLGSNRTIRVNVRLIAATNRNLKAMMEEGKFRSDLFYRLNVFPIQVPPLRERKEDIPLLVSYFVQKYAQRMGRKIDSIPSSAMQALVRYHWPGNIRELQNVIERSVILSTGRVLQLAMPEAGLPARGSVLTGGDSERERILRALRQTGGVVGGPRGAAALLGMKRTTLQSRMKKLGIRREYR
ncbi:MAG: sigma 54-interacting transcriptional regulator [Bryobacterales bacterium]|nr:sigma 54-interacting transcriptional regulator [Bryobacteraceae bacterium]MDW8129712.1 sigma 54-interacting transcriptional regulator [Bryobacterales bacterium]